MSDAANRPPNVLMIMADQLCASALGCYGHPVVKSPNIDRLAAAGTCFETCYCNSPLCGPSRMSMVTGKLAGNVGAYDNANELPASAPTFMHELRLAGYRTVLSGKMHFVGPDQLHGFEQRLTTDIYPAGFDWTANWLDGVGGNRGTCVEYLHESGPCAWNTQLDYDEEVLFRTREKLRDLARGEDARPFFLCASFTHPHDLFYTTEKYWNLYTDDEIPTPAAPAVAVDDMHPFNRWISIHHMIDRFPPTPETVRRARRAYYGMVSYFDELVGKLTSDLDLLGLAADTIVVVTSDHGEMLGEHGMWFKRTFFEDAMRVPMIWQGPTIAAGSRITQTVSLVDLYPTLVDLAGTTCAFDGCDGHSFRPLLAGDRSNAHDTAIGEYYGEGTIQPMRLIRRGPWKYVHVHNEAPLLFNLQDDPTEQTNRSGHNDVKAIEAALRDELLADFDGDATRARIIANQQLRRRLHQALSAGEVTRWNYSPVFDADRAYVRTLDAQATTRQRLVRVRSDP